MPTVAGTTNHQMALISPVIVPSAWQGPGMGSHLRRPLRNRLSRATLEVGNSVIQPGPRPPGSRLRGNDGEMCIGYSERIDGHAEVALGLALELACGGVDTLCFWQLQGREH